MQPDLVIEIVKSVAAADGTKLGEVPPLTDYIDPEVLERLDDQEKKGDWQFTFQFADHQVTVTHDSQVFIDGKPNVSNDIVE